MVIPLPSAVADGGGSTFSYADFVVSYSNNGVPVTCGDRIPLQCQEQTGACAGNATLGPPDGALYEQRDSGQLELGFLCHPIVDRARDSKLSSDFRILGRVLEGFGPVVSVSEDGSRYQVIGNWERDNQGFDLADEGLQFARFVRIASEDRSVMEIDAIEVGLER